MKMMAPTGSCFCALFLLIIPTLKIESLELPSYITACVYTDSNWHECVMANAKKALPSVLKGDKTYKVIPTDPLKISKLEFSSGENLQFIFNDVVVTGISDVKLDNLEVNVDQMSCDSNATFPKLTVESKYNLDGKIMNLPIKGKGHCKIVILDAHTQYGFEWTLIEKNDGEKYMKVQHPHFIIHENGANFDFQDLFNGDPTLGPQMNQFLNDNWREVMNEIGGSIGIALESVITSIFRGYLESIPYRYIFL